VKIIAMIATDEAVQECAERIIEELDQAED
jgi:hypothetical protein